jgi:hypothetical protein
MARLGAMLLRKHGRAFLATVRADGRPRVHPLCPILADGALMVGIISRSPKCGDLLRDSHYVLHALPGPSDAEFWLEGRARLLDEAEAAALAERNPLFRVPPGNTLFELRLSKAIATIFHPGPDGVPIPDRRRWSWRPSEADA